MGLENYEKLLFENEIFDNLIQLINTKNGIIFLKVIEHFKCKK